MTSPVVQKPKSEKIAMTSPVMQKPTSEKIAMTSPVVQTPNSGDTNSGADAESWTVNFMMPSEYSMETLPKPTDTDIRLARRGEHRARLVRLSYHACQSRQCGLHP